MDIRSVHAERRLKASQFFKAASVAAYRKNFREAAGNVRLAIAFDPWNSEYKERFAELQAALRAAESELVLLRRGDVAYSAQTVRIDVAGGRARRSAGSRPFGPLSGSVLAARAARVRFPVRTGWGWS